MKSFSQILHEVTGGTNPLCTVAEVAGVMRVHEQTVYGYKNDHTEPSYSKIISLSHYLIEEYGYYKLAMQFMPPCKGKANGRVDDDLLSIYEYGTDVHRAFREKDSTAYVNALAKMKTEINDLEAEGAKL